MRNIFLVLAVLLIGCDKSPAQATTQPQAEVTSIPVEAPPPPAPVVKEPWSHSKELHEYRFADFSCKTINFYTDSAKTTFSTWVYFTPTRQGAYLIEGADHAEKLVSGNE